MQKHRLVKFVTKTTCENETQTQELGLDPKIDGEERQTPQPRVLSSDIQTDGPQSPGDDGKKHPRVTPQASGSEAEISTWNNLSVTKMGERS